MLRYQVGDVIVYNGEGVCRVEACWGYRSCPAWKSRKNIIPWSPCIMKAPSLFPWIHRSICALPCPEERRKR